MPSKAPGPAMLAWPPTQTRSLVWSPTNWPMAADRVWNRARRWGGTSSAMASRISSARDRRSEASRSLVRGPRRPQALLDPPGVDDQDQHDPVAAEADHLDVAQPRPVQGRRGHHGGVVGEAGQQQRGPLGGLLPAGGAVEEAGGGLP